MVAMPDGSTITKEEWDERQQENSTLELESASNSSLIEEFVDTIMAGCHHETTGNFDGRGFCRNKSIEIMLLNAPAKTSRKGNGTKIRS
jgi:hypothetical protein